MSTASRPCPAPPRVPPGRSPSHLWPLLVPGLLLVLAPPARAAVSPGQAAEWREDLAFLAAELPKRHAGAFHTMPRDTFEARVARLDAAIPRMDHQQIAVAIAELVAGVADGHTRLTLPVDPAAGFFGGHSSTPEPRLDALRFHHLPIRLYIYSDGLYVRRIGRAHTRAAGARVLRIGGMTADDAMRAVRPVVQRDNDMQIAHLLPDFLVVPEVLAARGVTADPARAAFEVETPGGRRMTLDLGAVPYGDSVAWVDARDAAKAPVPLYLRDTGTNYRFEYLQGERIVYVPYNEVYDEEGETLEQFADRLFGFVESNPVEALVVDIRGNPGGNNARNRPMLMGLIRSAKLREPGRLFVIAGRGTFSAAMMFALDVEKYTQAIFVGEETGARPNHHGDSRKLELPHSGLTVRISSLYWQYSDPRDGRDAIAPHVPAPLASADYAANRDPALEAIRAMVAGPPNAPELRGKYEGFVHVAPGAYAFALEFGGADGASFGSKDLGLPPVGIEGLQHDARRLAFDVPLEGRTMRLEGRWMNGWLIGTLAVPANGTHLVVIPGE